MESNGGISHLYVGDEKEEEYGGQRYGIPLPPARLVVGYALTSKKKKSFLQPQLLQLARSKGIQFVSIDPKRLLSEQGPFDIVLHKLSGKEWSQGIEDYQREHPEVIVLDPPGAIQHVRNRQSMLEKVAHLKFPDSYVVKPLVVDGSAKSHEMFLAYDPFSVSELELPLVLQEFVNHGGVLFKVHIIGESVTVVRRFSLPDITKCDLSKCSGVFRFPRVSCAAASAEDVDLDPSVSELPPRPLLEGLARELRHRLGLHLFNVDMIRQKGTKDLYYVIDINYFPGYGKMPEYEHIFTDFLLNLVQSKYKQIPAA